MSSKIDYRSDIDGLRALAVLLVLCHHLGASWLPGGYVGVDVFFVISGFLITRVILKDLSAGTFTFADFYLRRMRRLLPASLVVLAASVIAAIWILLPEDLNRFSSSLKYVVLWVSNFYFHEATDGYFGQSSKLLPLLHTWSLAVEEQFYFIWPLLIFFLSRRLGLASSAPVILLLLLTATLFSVYEAVNSPSKAYFLLPARAFELLLGASAAFYYHRLPVLNGWRASLVSLLALFAILFSAVTLSKEDSFPGMNALMTCVGTVLLLTIAQKGVASRLLSFRPVVFVGLLSYSIYLWHWPIIALLNYLQIPLQGAIPMMVVGLVFSLAYVSWRFIEVPLRRQSTLSFKKTAFIFLLIPLIFCLVFERWVHQTEGWSSRFDKSMLDKISFRILAEDVYPECRQKGELDLSAFKDCRLGMPVVGSADVLILGDSHAAAARGLMDEVLLDAGLSAEYLSRSAAPYLPSLELIKKKSGLQINDTSYGVGNDALSAKIQTGGYQYVVLSARWPMYYLGKNESEQSTQYSLKAVNGEVGLAALSQGLNNALSIITKAGVAPVLLNSMPEMGRDTGSCELMSAHVSFKRNCGVDVRLVNERTEGFELLIPELKASYPSLIFWDVTGILCDKNECRSVLDGYPVYGDDDHLSLKGGRLLAEHYLARFDNPLNRESRPATKLWKQESEL